MKLRNRVINGFIWNFLERFAAQGVTLVVGIILARKLGTEPYGVVAIVSLMISIFVTFTGFNVGTALIQKKDADDLDFNSVFYFSAVLSIVIYTIIFALAPLLAKFYNIPELSPMVRVSSLTILISIFQGNQCAVVSRTLQYRLFFFATIGGTIGAAIIGITMAYTGFGAWALIVQGVFNTLIDTILLWILVKWRPKMMFSWERVKSLLGYSIKLWASNFLDTISSRIQGLVIGKKYTSSDLALYTKGESFPSTFVSSINSSVNNVLFPTISKIQDEKEKVYKYTSLSIKLGAFIIWPMMVGLAVCAKPLLEVLLGEEWVQCAQYIQIFCLGYAILPISTANLSAIKAVGKSDIVLKLNTILQLSTIVILIITVNFGPIWIAIGMVASKVIGQFINAFPNKKLLGYSYLNQIRDIFPSIIISLVMGAIVFSVLLLNYSDIITLLIQVPLGIVVYVLLSKLFQRDIFDYTLSILKNIKNKEKES